MSKSLDKIYAMAVPLPITAEAHEQAEQFAAKQPSVAKARQVYANTLAVWAMNDYCQMLEIATDLVSSDSWNPAVQLMADVADLVLPGMGRLECRPTYAPSTTCAVPPETWALRVGYSVVELSEDLQTARLLGFTSNVTNETLALSDLKPPEELIDHLHSLTPVPASLQTEANRSPLATLSHWFDSIVDASDNGWQTLEELLGTVSLTPAFSHRGPDPQSSEFDHQRPLSSQLTEETGASVHRGKLLNLAVRLGMQRVLLLIRLQSQTMDEIHISVQAYPVDQPCLPPDLELLIIDGSGEVFMQAQARQADNYIQLQFTGKLGEPFTTQLKLEDIYHSEQFIV